MSTVRTDGSFRSIPFKDLFSGGLSAAGPDTEEEVSARHVPGSNTTILQSSGRLIQTLSLPVATDGASMSALRAAVGATGSLVYHGGTRNARLSKLSGAQQVAPPHDIIKATLFFYLV